VITRHAAAGPPMAYDPVGMHRALDSAIGLPSRSRSALWMLVLLTPAAVRSSFIMPFLGCGDVVPGRRPLHITAVAFIRTDGPGARN
jgi:hypothetical protein